jgi:hypothetical protein
MGKSFHPRLLALFATSLLPTGLYAQATIRPVPGVALAWERGTTFASAPREASAGREANASVREADLSHLMPIEVKPVTAEVQGADAPATLGKEFAQLELTADYLGLSGIEGSGGDITTLRGGWKASLGEWSPENTSFSIEVGTEGSFYDFGAPAGGPGASVAGVADPFNDVYDTRIGARFVTRRSPKMSFYGGLELGVAGEDAVSLDDSLYTGGAVAMRYDASPQFALMLGVAGVSRFDDSAWILPYLGFDWRITESVRLKTEAAEVHLDCDVSDDWTLGLEATYGFRQYRLNEEGPLNGGSFRDEEVRAGINLGWHATDAIRLELSVGKMLWREVRFHDGQAGYLGEAELGKKEYAAFGMRVTF